MSWLFPWLVVGVAQAKDKMRRMEREIKDAKKEADKIRIANARAVNELYDICDELREQRRLKEEQENNERMLREYRALRKRQEEEVKARQKEEKQSEELVTFEVPSLKTEKPTVRVWHFVYTNDGEWLDSWGIDKEEIDYALNRTVVRDGQRNQLWVEVDQTSKSIAQETARRLVDEYLEIVNGNKKWWQIGNEG